MKKRMKTLTALCLVVAMLSTLCCGAVFANGDPNPVLVDYYGFDTPATSVELGDGTYQQLPVFFPQNATETDVTWSSDDSTIADVDATGLVTLNAVGTVHITATLTDTTGLADASQVTGVSYELNIKPTTGLSGNLKVSPSQIVIDAPGSQSVTVTGAAGAITATVAANEKTDIVTATLDGEMVNFTSNKPGYTLYEISDGVDTVSIPVVVQNYSVPNAKDAWTALYPDDTAIANDPGYFQWYFEKASTTDAGILGYGNNTTWTVMNAKDNYFASANKVRFDTSTNYSYFDYSGLGFTVTNVYQTFTIKAPMDGQVRISSSNVANFYFDGGNTDGAFFAIYKTPSDGSTTNRVFPAGENASEKKGSYTQEVVNNWFWLYPDNLTKVGDYCITGSNKALEQKHIDALSDFRANGAVIDVTKGDTLRLVFHAGENNYSDSGLRFIPQINYVVEEENDVLNLAREVTLKKGQSQTLTAQMVPYWNEPAVSMSAVYPADGKATLNSATYGTGMDLGIVSLNISSTHSGTGYYRLNFGGTSKLIKLTVADNDLDITYNSFQLKRFRFKTTNSTASPIVYTGYAVNEAVNADGSVDMANSNVVTNSWTAAANTSNTSNSWNVGISSLSQVIFLRGDVADMDLLFLKTF